MLSSVYREHKSWISILVANLVFLALAIWSDWQIIYLLWVYLIQTIIIYLYTYRRFWVVLDDADFEKEKINSFLFTHITFSSLVLLFLYDLSFGTGQLSLRTHILEQEGAEYASQLHFGIFHTIDALYLFFFIISFLWNHHKNHQEQVEADKQNKPDVSKIMEAANLRIIPSHMGVFAAVGAADNQSLHSIFIAFFVLLKMAADLGAHKNEFAQA